MRRALQILLFLELVPEYPDTWGLIWSPLQWVTAFLNWKPLKLTIFECAILIILMFARDRAKNRRVRMMRNAIWASGIGLIVWVFWGVFRGANTYQIQFQLHGIVLSYIATFAIAKVFTTPEDFFALGKTLLAASVYRAVTCISFYMNKALQHAPRPDYCTAHEDSVLFVVGIMLIVAYVVVRRGTIKKGTAIRLGLCVLVILLGIQFNNRRLAWVSLVGSLFLVYVVTPQNAFKKRLNKRLLIIAPILGLYVAIGVGRPEKIFAPLQALASVRSEENTSNKSREYENAGLLVTLGGGPLMGTGWGHEYIEINDSLSAGKAGFVQYRYLPHNSVLALLAFTGSIGFAIIWITFPICVHLSAFCFKHADLPLVKMAGFVGATQVLVVTNQWWGDLGLTFQLPGLIMATGMAAAIRLPWYVTGVAGAGRKAMASHAGAGS